MGAGKGDQMIRGQRGDFLSYLDGCARWLLFIALLTFFLFSFLPFPAWASTVRVEVIHSQDQYETGKNYPLLFRLIIAKPWYIHGTKGEPDTIPTALSVQKKPGFKITGIQFPPAESKKFEYADRPTPVFSGEILVKATLRVAKDAAMGEQVMEGKLSYQACSTTSCLPPENVSFSIPLKIVPPGTGASLMNQDLFRSSEQVMVYGKKEKGGKLGTGFWLTLLGFFFGGLALSFSPCVYPLIPITVSYFSQGRKKASIYTLINCVLYILGLAVTNSVLGVWAALSGRMVGSFLQNPWVILFLVCLFIALALSSFGFWEFRLPSGLTRLVSKSFGGYLGTFFMGLTLGIIAAPCLGPFIVGLLTFVAQKGDAFLGFISFFVLSVGLGLPLAVLAFFSGALTRLPTSGDWMLWVRKFMGWVLLFMAAYFAKPLISHNTAEVALMAAVVCAAGIHLGWLDRSGISVRRFSFFKKALGVALIGSSIFYFWTVGLMEKGIEWLPYKDALITRAAERKKPVILDFSAEWCEPCEMLNRKVFTDPEVVKLSRRFVTLRVDLTVPHPRQNEILGRYDVKGVPTIIFINKEGVEEKSLRIQSLVDKSEFLEKMKALMAR
jgi:thiol:disulfide interchange protein DsbD